MSKWTKAKFWIAVSIDGVTPIRQEVVGETNGLFGIHGHAYNYTITHLPTGYAINAVIPEGLKRTKKNLRILAAKLETAEVDWDFTDIEQIKSYKEQVLAIRNNCRFEEF